MHALPGTPGGVGGSPTLCSVPGDCVITVIWPFFARKSLRPEKAQIELECVGACVSSSEPEPILPGIPGGPFTSPAKAGPVLAPTSASVHVAAASLLVVRSILPPWVGIIAAGKATTGSAVFVYSGPHSARSRCLLLQPHGFEGVTHLAVDAQLRDPPVTHSVGLGLVFLERRAAGAPTTNQVNGHDNELSYVHALL